VLTCVSFAGKLLAPEASGKGNRLLSHQYPDSFVFYRHLNRRYPRIVRGDGIYLYDESGKRYLDGAGGAMVANIGHGVSEIADAVTEQMREVAYVNGTIFTNEAAEELAAGLAEVLPTPLKYSYFLCSGSEAIEAAVKLARQFWCERGIRSKWKVISRKPSYHGNTLAALSLSGREQYRALYEPLLTDFPRIPAPDPYRHPGCEDCTGESLEKEILRQGPERVAAFLAEPIIGASAGAVVPTLEYYGHVRDICRKYEVLFIADEVMAGMGRTGAWFSFEHFDIVPDICVLGKGLSGGYAPLSAVVATREIVEQVACGSGYFNHAQTYSHTPVICAAGRATLRYLKEHRLVERCRAMEGLFFSELSRLRRFETVGDIRGKGLLAGIEFVRDRDTKEPLPRSSRFAERLAERALQNGLILWPNVGHVDGADGDLVMLAPPFIITEDQIKELAALFELSLEQVS
jgi:adenosylmethionine-8-amino-7-oxononanoate aminotransferase